MSSPPLAVPPSSINSKVILAVPLASAAGVKLSVPSAATAGPALKSAALSLAVILNVSTCPASSAGPAEMAVAQAAIDCGPTSSKTDWLAPAVNDGSSLTPCHVIANVTLAEVSMPPLAVPPSSINSTVILAVPVALLTPVKVSKPLLSIAGC